MRKLTDSELVALAAIANCYAAEVLAANQDRANRECSPAYATCDCPAADLLQAEMERRRIFDAQPERTTLAEFVEQGLITGEFSSVNFELTQHVSGRRECRFGIYREKSGWTYGKTPDDVLSNAQDAGITKTSAEESRAELAALGDLPELPAPERAA
jgi:hypothetical protein